MYSIRKSKNLLIYKPTGHISAPDIIHYIQNVIKDPDFYPGMVEFIDLSGVENWSMSHSEVAQIVQVDQKDMRSIKEIQKTGIWAPKEIAFGMARMYQILAEEYHHDIFISKNLSEVYDYLQITAKDVSNTV